MKSKIVLFSLVAFIMVMMSSCASVVPVQECVEAADAHVYGFWGGLWHGMISGWSFIGSWFNSDIAVWSVANNGGWYTFGFLLGIGSFSGTSTAVYKSVRR